MDPDITEMANEVQSRIILHWNCRDFTKFPEVIRYYNNIREIYLKWNKLTTLPPWITELFHVTSLYLHGNLIKELPIELGKMSQLTALDLSANKLEQIPSCIGNLCNLRCLYLDENRIKDIPDELNQLKSLEVLSISKNLLVTLPEWIGSLPSLTILYVNNNQLKELPNRLTIAPNLSRIFVCSNRLRYLPLNGFLSTSGIRFDGNEFLNYLSFPLLCQKFPGLVDVGRFQDRDALAKGCFKSQYDANVLSIKLYTEMKELHENDIIIELPRRLFKIHEISENTTCSLWELALRKIYTERYIHTVDITESAHVKVFYSPRSTNTKQDFTLLPIYCTFYNLLTNGPTSICLNPYCPQPIFTEAWIVIGIGRHLGVQNIPAIALCCSKRCASTFTTYWNTIIKFLHWHSIN